MKAYRCVWNMFVIQDEPGLVSVRRPPNLGVDGRQVVELDRSSRPTMVRGSTEPETDQSALQKQVAHQFS